MGKVLKFHFFIYTASMKVVIAGASGFVGTVLVERLRQDPSLEVRSLARSVKPSCDLFSLLDVEEALKGQEQAIYLVHSMLPSSHLSQGNFADYDLILADNFARAAKKNGLQRILYLGGILPSQSQNSPLDLSLHLKSRLEVEEIFKSYNIPVLALRAGIVMGKEGSSFQMLMRLVQRLSVMICPAWTRRKSSPIHVRDVAESFYYALQNPHLNGAFDLGSGELLSYLEMLQSCSKKMHKKRLFIDVPFFSPTLSKLWVRVVTGAPKALVYPLVDSLRHDMSPDPSKLLKIPDWKYTSFNETLDEIVAGLSANSKLPLPSAYTATVPTERFHVVQSVQRHRLPSGKTAEWASQEYVRWLNAESVGLIRVHTKDKKTSFYALGTRLKLLELTMSEDRSSNERVLFYITGGIFEIGRAHV